MVVEWEWGCPMGDNYQPIRRINITLSVIKWNFPQRFQKAGRSSPKGKPCSVQTLPKSGSSTRNQHNIVKGLPSFYIFFLRCCHQPECEHPICHSGEPPATLHWYPGGPPITHIPLPVPDPARPWGGQTRSSWKGVCAGHYTTKRVDTSDSA